MYKIRNLCLSSFLTCFAVASSKRSRGFANEVSVSIKKHRQNMTSREGLENKDRV
jgi:hypothetical protein